MAGQKLLDVDEQLKALAAIRDQLTAVVSDWDKRIAETPNNAPASLLKSLSTDKPLATNGNVKLPLSLKFNKRKSTK